MSNRLYLDQNQKLFVVLSYAGGTKYFRHMTETKLKNFVSVNGNSLREIHASYSVIQIVRDPVSRYMSWFDKQYIRPKRRPGDTNFTFWINRLMTTSWIDQFFETAQKECHYNGHTNFQSVWPKLQLPIIWKDDWQYLKMEDINPYFLNEPKVSIIRDPKEYIGVWEVLEKSKKKYTISKIKELYKSDIDWYNSLNFIKIT